MATARLDEVGYWSEVKLDIVRKYASAYSTIMDRQASIRGHCYIDAFAGAGVHISRQTGRFVAGSPLNALNVSPAFKEFHFIDLDGGRAALLRDFAAGRSDVFIHEGDCNEILIDKVFPRVRYSDYRRGLCLLDPYGLHLRWEVIQAAGHERSIEVFLNFPVMDMKMNVLWGNPNRVQAAQAGRMDAFWGDHTWRDVAYVRSPGLFGDMEHKARDAAIAAAFQERLRREAGFSFVPDPMPMTNSKGAIVYFLFFASPNRTGSKIVNDIFTRYGKRGMQNGSQIPD